LEEAQHGFGPWIEFGVRVEVSWWWALPAY